MEIIDPQTYEIESGFKRLTAIGSWVFLGFVLFFIAIPFIPDESHSRNPNAIYILSMIGAIFFGLLSWYGFTIIKRLPFSSVTIDTDGIWPSHKGKKDALVRWQAITNIKERPVMQRLELIGSKGTPLLRIEYQLSNFDKLRAQLIERINIKKYQYLPMSFSKKRIYHLFYLSCGLGFAWLGWYVGQDSPLFGYGGMAFVVFMLGYEYLTTAWSLSLDHHGWTVRYPMLSRCFQYNDIITVNLSDTLVKGARHPEVHVLLNNIKKPIKFKALGIDAVLLYKILTRILEKKATASKKAD
jgi:hypothetical protein